MKPALLFRLLLITALSASLLATAATPAVSVYGAASCNGPVITVNVFADITNVPLISFGVQLGYDPTVVQEQTAVKNSAVWYFSDGTNQISYRDPDTSTPGSILTIGGKLDGLNPLQGVIGSHVLLATATFSRLAPQSPVIFTLGLAHPQAYANFVTTIGDVLDYATNDFALLSVTNDPADTNLDGLPDAWEIAHFGSVNAYTWSDDPDHDGFNNLQEYEADTDPLDATSYLHMTGASWAGSGVTVRWQGGIQATQYLLRTFALQGTNSAWTIIATDLPPTTVMGSHVDPTAPASTVFYRISANR